MEAKSSSPVPVAYPLLGAFLGGTLGVLTWSQVAPWSMRNDVLVPGLGGAVIGVLIASLFGSKQGSGPTRPCPHCAEPIKPEAKVCKHCGRDITPTTTETKP